MNRQSIQYSRYFARSRRQRASAPDHDAAAPAAPTVARAAAATASATESAAAPGCIQPGSRGPPPQPGASKPAPFRKPPEDGVAMGEKVYHGPVSDTHLPLPTH